ncbi:MAG: NYN domain-containing protein [Patescibacteria group bacterium]
MRKLGNNHAFIDSQNVNLAIRGLGWKLDWKRFRVYLREKYAVTKAFLFIGYIEGNNDLYVALQDAGFICIFKPTLEYKDGTTKGNVDAELVLHAMIEFTNYERAVLVTGDGDFYCLVKHWIEHEKLERVLIPNYFRFSALLKRFGKKRLDFMNDLQGLLAYKKRTP